MGTLAAGAAPFIHKHAIKDVYSHPLGHLTSARPRRAHLCDQLLTLRSPPTSPSGNGATNRRAPTSGPVGEVQRAFELVRKLPRNQQRRIIETIRALVGQFKRTAS